MWSLLPERWAVEWWRGSAVELDAHRIDALPARDQRSRERNGRIGRLRSFPYVVFRVHVVDGTHWAKLETAASL